MRDVCCHPEKNESAEINKKIMKTTNEKANKTSYPVKGWIKNSFCDWEGKISTVIFLPGCNFRCPFCQNWDLATKPESFVSLDWEEIKKSISADMDFIDGVVITGGEPFMFSALENLLMELKETGFKLKIDTNGSFPEKIEKVLSENLVDSISMDVKNSLNIEDYGKTAGGINGHVLENVKNSIEIIRSSGIDYEFRTTVLPVFHSLSKIKDIGKYLNRAKRYILQGYRGIGVNPEFKCDKIFSREEMETFKKEVEEFFDECKLRYYK